MDILGQILWFMIFVTPLIVIPIIWKLSKKKKLIRILIGLGFSIILSFLLYHISLRIIFRNGIG